MKRNLVLLSMAVAATAHADQMARPVTDVATLEQASGRSRIVFSCDTSALGTDAAVRQALLRFELVGEAVARTVSLRVHPLTSSRGGGALTYDEGQWAHASVDLSRAGSVVVDLTPLVKEIVEWDRPAHGFVVTVDPAAGDGLASVEASRLAGIADGTVEIRWRKTTPRGVGG